jgi:hypothetical protein
MILYVRYKNGKSDYTNALLLDSLIRDEEITMFYRPSERQWIEIDSMRIRREDVCHYEGIERRNHPLHI